MLTLQKRITSSGILECRRHFSSLVSTRSLPRSIEVMNSQSLPLPPTQKFGDRASTMLSWVVNFL